MMQPSGEDGLSWGADEAKFAFWDRDDQMPTPRPRHVKEIY